MGTVTRIGRGPAGLPFSRMTLKDGRFFLSGQVAQNPETGRIDHPGCYEQSLIVLGNIRGILAEAGFVPEQVAKMTVFLTDMGQKDAFSCQISKKWDNCHTLPALLPLSCGFRVRL